MVIHFEKLLRRFEGQSHNIGPEDFVFDSNGDIWVAGWVRGTWPGVSKLGSTDAYLNKVLGTKIRTFWILLECLRTAERSHVRCCGR